VYQGCADVTWDPTGTVITYKIRWQEEAKGLPNLEQKMDINERCFDGNIGYIF